MPVLFAWNEITETELSFSGRKQNTRTKQREKNEKENTQWQNETTKVQIQKWSDDLVAMV